jgi:hypothetical protein
MGSPVADWRPLERLADRFLGAIASETSPDVDEAAPSASRKLAGHQRETLPPDLLPLVPRGGRWHQQPPGSDPRRQARGGRSATVGTRNDTLNRIAFRLGQIVGSGRLDEPAAERLLLDGALSIGLEEREAVSTVRSGLQAGERVVQQTAGTPCVEIS